MASSEPRADPNEASATLGESKEGRVGGRGKMFNELERIEDGTGFAEWAWVGGFLCEGDSLVEVRVVWWSLEVEGKRLKETEFSSNC